MNFYKHQTFQASSLVQLAAIAPWFMFGSSFKTAPVLILVALFCSIAIAYVTTLRVKLAVPRCSECSSKRMKTALLSGVSFLSGLTLLLAGIVYARTLGETAKNMAIVGVSLLGVSWLGSWYGSSRFGVRLLSVNSESAKFRVPRQA